MQQKMDDMEKELLEVRQENKKWKALDKKLKEDVSEGDEQEQEQEQTQEYYMGSEASPQKSATQAPWSQDSDPWQTEATKHGFNKALNKAGHRRTKKNLLMPVRPLSHSSRVNPRVLVWLNSSGIGIRGTRGSSKAGTAAGATRTGARPATTADEVT